MKKQQNVLWEFFASVKLALFTLLILAVTSIIGTIIEQGKPLESYYQRYGESWARLFEILNVPNMYGSWWFLSLLVLLSINITVCSLNRLPHVWKIVTQDNFGIDTKRLEHMAHSFFYSEAPLDETVQAMQDVLPKSGWRMRHKKDSGGVIFFGQKGAWTRFGVYGVHLSILIIFIGAIIGSLYGFKSSVLLPEGRTTDKVYRSDNLPPIELGFQVRCDSFRLSYYDTGAPKEFRSELTVIENGKDVFSRSVIVNDPMQHKGLTFYQASYEALENRYIVDIENNATKAEQKFSLMPRQETEWKQEGLSFGIVNRMGPVGMGQYRHRIWFSDGKGNPVEFWADEDVPVLVKRADATYAFTIKQHFATGLQVVKDPGVWYVYAGCTLMLLGLMVAFFLSHRRIWVYIRKEGSRTSVLLSGNSNKNKVGFEKDIEAIASLFEKSDSLKLTKE